MAAIWNQITNTPLPSFWTDTDFNDQVARIASTTVVTASSSPQLFESWLSDVQTVFLCIDDARGFDWRQSVSSQLLRLTNLLTIHPEDWRSYPFESYKSASQYAQAALVLYFVAAYERQYLWFDETRVHFNCNEIRDRILGCYFQQQPVYIKAKNSHHDDLNWLRENRHRFVGQWIAVKEGKLLGVGTNALDVYNLAKRKGVKRPLVVLVKSQEEQPFGGW